MCALLMRVKPACCIVGRIKGEKPQCRLVTYIGLYGWRYSSRVPERDRDLLGGPCVHAYGPVYS